MAYKSINNILNAKIKKMIYVVKHLWGGIFDKDKINGFVYCVM